MVSLRVEARRSQVELANCGVGFAPLSSVRRDRRVDRQHHVLQFATVDLQQTLVVKFSERRRRNTRYSLRAFARDLGTDHATLSQILRRRRPLTPRMIRQLGGRLGLCAADIAEACARQNAQTVLQFAGSPAFRPNSRWIATRTGLPLDAVNTSLQRLLHQRQLNMAAADRWTISPAHA